MDNINSCIVKPIDNLKNITDLLQHRAKNQPEKITYTFLSDGKNKEISITYKELDIKARAIAARLQSLKHTGQNLLLIFPPGLEFISAFFGCLYSGSVAVPAHPPNTGRSNQNSSKIMAIIKDAEISVLLTTSSLQPKIEKLLFSFGSNIYEKTQIVLTDCINTNEAEEWNTILINDKLALLQYTSGSTSSPKGVMISHNNLLHNLKMISKHFEHTPDSCGMIWLPPYHDMGLIGGILQPLYAGFPVILMSPMAFLQRPFNWLRAISHYKATISGGPNFAYDLCIKKISAQQLRMLDLSTWEIAFNGSDTIRNDTLERFVEVFEPCGFNKEAFFTCYGLAEATLFVAGGLKKSVPIVKKINSESIKHNRVELFEEEKTLEIVSCGHCSSDQKIKIIDPKTLFECPNDRLGEIWISGPSVAQGYYKKHEETKRIFGAYIFNSNEGPFLRTGDIGFISGHRLYVTGRLKELILIHGCNYYPQDIEFTINKTHSELQGLSAVFSVNIDNEERIVIIQEVKPHILKKYESGKIIDSIRRSVSEHHNLSVYAVLLTKPGSIPKTSSGKFQRHICREKFLCKDFNMLEEWQQSNFTDQKQCVNLCIEKDIPQNQSYTVNDITNWLKIKISERLKLVPESIDENLYFSYYGLNSIDAIYISKELEEFLRCQISPTLVYNYPTIKELAQYLAQNINDIKNSNENQTFQTKLTKLEDIAIIGMSCRFPGASNPDDFWEILKEGTDTITDIPHSRFEIDSFDNLHLLNKKNTKRNSRWGGFIEQIEQFDPEFFGIAPFEANYMDPQQRLLLEVAWEALENAGISPDQINDTQSGIFIGISTNDYSQLFHKYPFRNNPYFSTGNAQSISANRLSYFLNLHGPSVAVDTACSSSLVAVHLACQSLQQNECDLALTGGVNAILSMDLTSIFSKAGMLSHDGFCKTFDANADGYVRGEGCGIVVLKRISDAIRNADNILALIKGSAVNQDGRSNGLTAPNGLAQQAVINKALENAVVLPSKISYVETHGTGTSLGDPIELNAISEILLSGRNSEDTCYVGSVKTNIGHLEAAAGIAGLIKVVLALQHKVIPLNLNFKKLNPLINIKNTPIKIPTTKNLEWHKIEGKRLAGVSSFGFGGTNSHVIIEEAPKFAKKFNVIERPLNILTLSARNLNALKAYSQRLNDFLISHPNENLSDICYSANTGRYHMKHRIALLAESIDQAKKKLSAFISNPESHKIIKGCSKNNPKVAFLFAGMDLQYINVGKLLYKTEPTFRQTLDHCNKITYPHIKRNLMEIMYPESNAKLQRSNFAYTLSALFSIEYALYELWKSWGIKPSVVLGHGIGEYVAACVSGVFSLEDGLKLVITLGKLLQTLANNGEMIAVLADQKQTKDITELYDSDISITAINGPKNLFVSCIRHQLKSVKAALICKGCNPKHLNIPYALHSPFIEPIMYNFKKIAEKVHFESPRLQFVSNVTGDYLKDEIASPEYWCDHLRRPVRFLDSIKTLYNDEYDVYLEIGPDSTLLKMAQDIVPQNFGTWLPSLQHMRSDWNQLLLSLGELHTTGFPIDWIGFDKGYNRHRICLPTYPFQRKRCWLKSENVSLDHSPIINLLTQSNVGELVKILEDTERFSKEELKLLPNIINTLSGEIKSQKNSIIDDWIYHIEWKFVPRRTEFKEGKYTEHRRSWLIISDQDGIGQSLADLLEKQNQKCFIVYCGESYFHEKNSRIWTLNPSSHKHFERLFYEDLNIIKEPLKGIIHLWALDTIFLKKQSMSFLDHDLIIGCGSLLYMTKALVKSHRSISTKIWIVTRGAVLCKPYQDDLHITQAPLWGIGKSIFLEYPDLRGGIIDISPKSTLDEAENILEEVWNPQAKDYVSLREGKRYVARLIPKKINYMNQELKFNSDFSYLITGGLGELGLKIAKWMIEKGALNLVLISRNGIVADNQEAINEIKQAGTYIRVIKADVSNRNDMLKVFKEIKTTMPPLRGIFHAAGVLNDGIVQNQNWEQFIQVMNPKVKGALNLHTLTQDMHIDFFVLFSSIASVIGSPGQSNYAAANAFMDAISYYRNKLGLACLSINWGPWNETGMSKNLNKSYQEGLIDKGLELINTNKGLKVLELLMSRSTPQVVVLPINWFIFTQYQSDFQIPLINELAKNKISKKEDKQQVQFLDKLKNMPVTHRQEFIVSYIQKYVNDHLGSSLEMNSQLPLIDIGIDSLAAIQIRNWIKTNIDIDIPIEKFIDGSNISQIAQIVLFRLSLRETISPNSISTDINNDDYEVIKL